MEIFELFNNILVIHLKSSQTEEEIFYNSFFLQPHGKVILITFIYSDGKCYFTHAWGDAIKHGFLI